MTPGSSEETPKGVPAARGCRIRVEPGEGAGRRLDVLLAERLALSRSRVRWLLGAGRVRVDGRRVGPRRGGLMLAAGSVVAVEPFDHPEEWLPEPEPEAPLAVLARGPDWVAVDKPAGRPVHPFRPGERGTVLGALLAREPRVAGVGEGGLRSGVVHRLDVGTSGVLFFALSDERFRSLRSAFAEHRVHKRYRALLEGELGGRGVESPRLLVARHRPARVRVAGPDEQGGRPTRLAWRAVEALAGATLVEVDLETGFLHQIRATFAALGHPVVGDGAYGSTHHPELGEVGRPLLHAARVVVGDLRAESPDPADLAAALELLRRA